MTSKPSHFEWSKLPPRERQILEIVYAGGEASSQEVLKKLPNAPSYSAVRATMQKMVRKNLLACHRKGLKYVFAPVVPAERMRVSALSRLVSAFFNNSPMAVVSSLLDSDDLHLSSKELQELKSLIAQKEKNKKERKG